MSDPRPAYLPLGLLALVVVVAHVIVALTTPFEFHRDEFLYMAMGRNLRLFAMDFPPFIALLSETQRTLLGDSLLALRSGPALAHGALVVLTGWIAFALGGRPFAQLLGAIAVATAPLFLRAGTLFQPVIFDQLWWTCVLAALVRLYHAQPPRRATGGWIAVGVFAGLGLLTKFSIGFLGAGVLGALLLADRRALATRGPWLAAAAGLVVGAPSILGQLNLDFPVVGQMGDLQDSQLERIDYADWWLELVLMHGPVAFLLALTGAIALLLRRDFARWRVVGWSALLAFAVILVLRGKPYYVGPVFPTWFAAGAVVLDEALRAGMRRPRFAHAIRAIVVVLVASWGLSTLPMGLPILSPERSARFAAALGVTTATTTNQGVVLELPQDYADMLGWERKVDEIARVYHSLPAAERERAVIVADNYGQAGAIDFYGPRRGLPPARAHVGSYWFWGPGELPGDVIVKVGDDRTDLERHCGELELATVIAEPWVVPEERDLPIWICRQPRETLQQIWPRFEGVN